MNVVRHYRESMKNIVRQNLRVVVDCSYYHVGKCGLAEIKRTDACVIQQVV